MKEYETRVLEGVIDMHVHGAPDLVPRRLDEISLVSEMKSVGMKAVLLKSHHTLTADRAWLIRRVIPDFGVFGSLMLNIPATGGLNPRAVETAIKFGAKEIWMPTVSSSHHLEYEGKDPRNGLTVLTKNGEPTSEVIEILNLIADADIIMGTGHLSVNECRVLVTTAIEVGVRKILLTHPEWKLVNMSIELQKELSRKGAFVEHCYYATTALGGGLNPVEIAEQIRGVGAERCVMATDFGHKLLPDPISGMKEYILKMMECGISSEEVQKMTKQNPATLLNLG